MVSVVIECTKVPNSVQWFLSIYKVYSEAMPSPDDPNASNSSLYITRFTTIDLLLDKYYLSFHFVAIVNEQLLVR